MNTKTNEKVQTTFEALKGVLGLSNVMQSPRMEKIIVSVGTGRIRKDKQKLELIQDRLTKITGQKSSPRKAKKSIASFKLREGEIIGYKVTLRGKNMYSFLDRLIHIALPRTRDFRGIQRKSIDEMGNLSIGITEHSIFTEVADENLQDIFSFSVVLVSSAKTRKEAEVFFSHIGIPFVKE